MDWCPKWNTHGLDALSGKIITLSDLKTILETIAFPFPFLQNQSDADSY